MTPETLSKLEDHTRRQMLARGLCDGNTEKLSHIQTLPLFEVAMYGKAAFKKRKVAPNLPHLRQATKPVTAWRFPVMVAPRG